MRPGATRICAVWPRRASLRMRCAATAQRSRTATADAGATAHRCLGECRAARGNAADGQWLSAIDADLPIINGIEINSIKEIYKSRSELTAALLRARLGCRSAPLGAAQYGAVHRRPVSEDHRQRRHAAGHSACFHGRQRTGIAHPRVIIDASPGASATIIEHHVRRAMHAPLNNSNTHIALGARCAARALPRLCDGRRRHPFRFARHSSGPKAATASNSPSPWAAVWCARRWRRA